MCNAIKWCAVMKTMNHHQTACLKCLTFEIEKTFVSEIMRYVARGTTRDNPFANNEETFQSLKTRYDKFLWNSFDTKLYGVEPLLVNATSIIVPHSTQCGLPITIYHSLVHDTF